MVIGMDAVLAQRSAQELGGPVGDDLVGVHIVTGAGAGLEGIHHELVVPFAIDDFLGGFLDGAGPFGIQQAQLQVNFGGGPFDRRPSTR